MPEVASCRRKPFQLAADETVDSVVAFYRRRSFRVTGHPRTSILERRAVP